MANYLTITPSMKTERGRRKKTIKRNLQAGPVTLGYMAVFLIAIICLFYLFQVVSISAAGYESSEIADDIRRLEKENDNIRLEIDEAQSLNKIESKVDQSGMVPIDSKSIKFVTEEGAIAVR